MTTTHFVWDRLSDNVLAEYDDAGDPIAQYTNEPGQFGELVSQHRGGDTSTYHYDGLGNTRQLTDENQNVTDEYTFSAFGEEVAKTGTTVNPFGFQGALGYYANPATEDLYWQATYYQPSIGRWLSTPYELAGDAIGAPLLLMADPWANWDENGESTAEELVPEPGALGCEAGCIPPEVKITITSVSKIGLFGNFSGPVTTSRTRFTLTA